MKLVKTANGNKLKISKKEWTTLGKKAGWMPSDPSTFSDEDLGPIYDPDTEETALLGEEEGYISAYKDGYNDGVLAKKKDDKYFYSNPYRTDTQAFEDWQRGFNDGWNGKETQDDYREFMDSLLPDNPAKIKPAIQLITSPQGSLIPKSEFDKKKLDQILGKHEFNALPETIMALYKKVWEGTNEYKYDWNSGYSLLIDGKGIQQYLEYLAEKTKQ